MKEFEATIYFKSGREVTIPLGEGTTEDVTAFSLAQEFRVTWCDSEVTNSVGMAIEKSSKRAIGFSGDTVEYFEIREVEA